MPSVNRPRIDWMPGKAAQAALRTAEQRRPDLRQQALIDWIVIVGVSAIEHHPWCPPALHGRNRDTWIARPAALPVDSCATHTEKRKAPGTDTS